MKKYNSILLCVFSALCLLSCRNDAPDYPGPDPSESWGTIVDGGSIASISLYCIEKYNNHIGEIYYEYNPRVKTLKSYTDFYLQLELNGTDVSFQSNDYEEMATVLNLQKNYCLAKSSFMLEEYKKYQKETNSLMEWPLFLTAYVSGEVSITCDKVLFGEEPGTKLNKHFSVNRYYSIFDMFIENAGYSCLPIGIENPSMLYNFGEKIPYDMDEFFVKGTWLQPQYYLQFKYNDTPTERYDDITLTLSFPMIREFVTEYAVAIHRGKVMEAPRLLENVYEAKCKIKFEWE